jgi:homoserine dehydrogenase
VPAVDDIPVALLGYGTVGSAVDRHLRENADTIAEVTGRRLRVVHALVRDLDKVRPYPALPGVLTTDFARIRDDAGVIAVAEVMGGLEPARGYLEELLAAGKGVASANKRLLARGDNELLQQVRAGGSVCGAVPVLDLLRSGIPAGAVTRVSGVVNGTTNFMLEQMESGTSYEATLAEAQRLGYAEADPTEDVTGADSAAKLAIIATIAFGTKVTLSDVSHEGIAPGTADSARAARASGKALRLVATATPESADVALVELPPAHPFASLHGADNAVSIEGVGFREILLSGPGAGGAATAAAVVADLLQLTC